jgi:hypothetical protein
MSMRFFLKKVTTASKQSSYRFTVAALSLLMVSGVFLMLQSRAEAIRFQNRSLYINSSVPGDTTFYTVTFTYPTVNNVGSVRMHFCTESIAYLPCTAPTGLNVSAAILSSQSGFTGFAINNAETTSNQLVISRPAAPSPMQESKYTFTNVQNPTIPQKFYVRLSSHATNNGTGAVIDYGSVASATATELSIETQVPPILIFCTGREIPNFECEDAVGPNFEDFGEPEPNETMYTQSEMMAYTNARNGYSVTYAGRGLTSGIYEIPAIGDEAEESIPGKPQFGLNLAINTEPPVGAAPVGPATNTYLNPDYTEPNKFLFNVGDTVVTSDFVTLNRKYTVSYLINFPPDQQPGVYNTTVTFICTGNF